MNRGKVSLKEEAFRALSRREWEKALTLFQRICDQNPEDLRSRVKVAELLERLGKREEAISTYREIGEAYAKDGFILEAISVNKILLRLDPHSKETNQRLAQLYLEKIHRERRSFSSIPFIPILSDLKEDELQSFLDRLQTRTFRKGEIIWEEGSEGDAIMILSKGEVRVSKRDPKGREIWIRDLQEGDCFGEFGFFLDGKRHAKIEAKTDCELIEIPRNELEEILRLHPRGKEVLHEFYKKKVLDLLLALSPLFSPLDPKEREIVGKRFRLRALPPETVIFKGGESSSSLYVIKRGEVEIYTQDPYGTKTLLGRLGSGNFFGEIGVLLNTPRMAFAKTTKETELLELTKEDFDDLISQFPKLQMRVKELSSKRLIRMKETLSRKVAERAKGMGV